MAFKLKGSGGIDGKQPYFKQSGFGPRADFTIMKNNSRYDDKALDKKEDEAGVGGNSNVKVMKDGDVNKTQAAKIAKSKTDFAKKTAAEKKAMQDAANAKRKAFEASDEYKKRTSGLKHVPWAEAHKEKSAHPNTAQAHGSPTKKKGFHKMPDGKMMADSAMKKRGLWDNIHDKRKRGETMRKKGDKGAPTEKAIRDSQ